MNAGDLYPQIPLPYHPGENVYVCMFMYAYYQDGNIFGCTCMYMRVYICCVLRVITYVYVRVYYMCRYIKILDILNGHQVC